MRLHHSFDSGQPGGTTITTGNSGTGGDPFDSVTIGSGAGVVYDSTALRGPLSGHFTTVGTATASVNWTSSLGGAKPRLYGRFEVRPGALSAITPLLRLRSGGVQSARVTIDTAGRVALRDTGSSQVATSAATMTTGDVWLVEWDVAVGSSADGVLRIYYTPTATTPDETLTASGANFGTGSIDEVNVGVAAGTSNANVRLDSVVVTDVGFPGPVAQRGTVPLGGSGVLAAGGLPVAAGGALLAGVSAGSTAGVRAVPGAGVLLGAGTVAVAGLPVRAGVGVLPAAGGVAVAGSGVAVSGVSLAGVGLVGSAGVPVGRAGVLLPGVSGGLVAGVGVPVGAAVLAAAGGVLTAGVGVPSGVVVLAGVGGLASAAAGAGQGQAVLPGVSAGGVAGLVVAAGSTLLPGVGSLTATAADSGGGVPVAGRGRVRVPAGSAVVVPAGSTAVVPTGA